MMSRPDCDYEYHLRRVYEGIRLHTGRTAHVCLLSGDITVHMSAQEPAPRMFWPKEIWGRFADSLDNFRVRSADTTATV